MNLLRAYFARHFARQLSRFGHAKRKADGKAVARQIRDELGLEPDRRLA